MRPDWTWVLGLDFGIRDKCAATVVGWLPNSQILYIPRSFRFTATPSSIADEYRDLDAEYQFIRVVGDLGGLGAAFGVEMQRRFAIPIVAAKKHDKLGSIRFVNGLLRQGHLKVVRSGCEDLLEEWRDLPWNEAGTREAEGYVADASDSATYAIVACRAFYEEAAAPRKTPEQQIHEDVWSKRVAAIEAQRSGSWWETM